MIGVTPPPPPMDSILGGVETQFHPSLTNNGLTIPGVVVSRFELYSTAAARAKALRYYTQNSIYVGKEADRFDTREEKMSTIFPLTTSCAGMATTIGTCVFVPKDVLDLRFPEGPILSGEPTPFGMCDFAGRWIMKRPGDPALRTMATLQYGAVVYVTTLMTVGRYPYPIIVGPPPAARFVQVAIQSIAQEASAHADMVLTLTGAAIGLTGSEARDVDTGWKSSVVGDLTNVWMSKIWGVEVDTPVRWAYAQEEWQ